MESPIQYLLQHKESVLSAFTGSPGEAWKCLVADIQIDAAMKENTFRALVKNFVETCQYFERLNNGLNKSIDTGLNEKLNETIAELNNQLNNERELNTGLNNRLNTLEGLNNRLNNEIERLNNGLNKSIDTGLNKTEEKLNNMDTEQVKQKLNIDGWTVAKSGRYFRAFRKIRGRVVGVHLGVTIDGAAEKIKAKAVQFSVDSDDTNQKG